MADRLHVAFLITRADDLGGAQVHVRDLATELQERGHEVSVVSGRPGPLADILRERGIAFRSAPHLRRPLRPVWDLRALLEIRRILSELQPDLLSTHSSKAGILGRIAGRSLGIPVVFTAHGWSFGRGRPWPQRWFYQLVEAIASPLASRIITVSNTDFQLAARSGVARRNQMVTIRNAMPRIAREFIADPGISPPALIMVARFAPPKDHALLLRALASVTDWDWTFTFVGEGPGEARAKELASELGIGHRISFLGFTPEVPQILARHQAFVLVSNYEGLPRSILEAMRAGLPVIATDTGGVREAVHQGKSGLLVPPHDLDALSESLARVISDSDLRIRMGRSSRRYFEEQFAFERLVEQTLSVYRKVLRNGRED